MKIRNGFVSNSSSSSFIILKSNLTMKEKDMILNHCKIGEEIDDKLKAKGEELKYEWYEEWFIEEDEHVLYCHTSMDNFDLMTFIIDEVGLDSTDMIDMGDNWYDGDFFQCDEYQDFLLKLRDVKINNIKKSTNSKK